MTFISLTSYYSLQDITWFIKKVLHHIKFIAQSRLSLCDPMDCSRPGSSAHGNLQARILEWVAISFSRGSSWPRDRTWVSHFAGRLFTICILSLISVFSLYYFKNSFSPPVSLSCSSLSHLYKAPIDISQSIQIMYNKINVWRVAMTEKSTFRRRSNLKKKKKKPN